MVTFNINLLPYREEMKRAAQRQMMVLALGAVGLSVAAGVGVHGIIAAQVATQEQRNQFLKTENNALDKKIEEIRTLKEGIDTLKAQQEIVQQLQSDRSAAVQMLEQMARLVPTGVYLRSIKQTGQKINATGYAQSNDLVSVLMTQLQGSPYLTKPELVEIKSATVGNRRYAEFSLNFELKKQVAEPAAGKSAAKITAGKSPMGLPPAAPAKNGGGA